MKKLEREIKKVIERAGCTIVSITQNKHYVLTLNHPTAGQFKITSPVSPGDTMWASLLRQDIERRIREGRR